MKLTISEYNFKGSDMEEPLKDLRKTAEDSYEFLSLALFVSYEMKKGM